MGTWDSLGADDYFTGIEPGEQQFLYLFSVLSCAKKISFITEKSVNFVYRLQRIYN